MALMKAFSEFSFLESKEPRIKVGLSLFKKICAVCFNQSPLKMMKKAIILKALFFLKVFKFLSLVFGHIEKTTSLER